MRKIAPYVFHEDSRGSFRGLTQQGWAEVNFVQTHPGQIRGGHYHRHTTELFFIISGDVEITIRHVMTNESKTFMARPGDLFLVEPLEIHTFRTRTVAQWINMLSEAFDAEQPDLHRES